MFSCRSVRSLMVNHMQISFRPQISFRVVLMIQAVTGLSSNQIHPLMVHFPIALLMVAPVFVLLGAVLRDARGRNMLFSALLIMCLGTAGTFAARLSTTMAVA